MADNSVLPGTGDTYASDDIGGVKFPRVKMIHGADGVNAGDVSTANPFPVALPSGLTVAVPSGVALVAPSGVVALVPSGFTANLPSGVSSVLYGSGALISSANPLQVGVPSGVDARISAPSGIGLNLPSGIALQGGTGAPISLTNPLPVRVFTGIALGALASGLPVTPQNPFQVGLYGSGARIDHTNPMPVSIPSGVSVSISSVTVQGIDAHDSALTANPVTVGGFASSTAPASVTDSDAVRGWFDNNGAQWVGIQSAGTKVLAGAGVAATALRVAIATDQVPIPGTQASGARFTVEQPSGTSFTVGPASGAAFIASRPTGYINPVFAVGPAAEGSRPTGSPVSIGLVAHGQTGVASGAMVRPMSDTLGKQVVLPGAPLSARAQGMAGLQGTGSRTIIPAPGSGISIVVTSIQAVNASPTYAARVVIHDGTATLHGGFAPPNGGGFAPNGGQFPLFVANPNSAIQGVCLASGADVDVVVSGYRVTNP